MRQAEALDQQAFLREGSGFRHPDPGLGQASQQMPPEQQLAMVHAAIARLKKYGRDDHQAGTDDEFQSLVKQMLLWEEDYMAGNTSRHTAAWEVWLHQEPGTRAAQVALKTVQEGVRLEFIHPMHPDQQKHPRHAQRMEQMRKLLTRLKGEKEAQSLLDRDSPGRVQFPNRESVEEHAEFVLEQRDKLRASRTLFTPEELGMEGPPLVIIGLGVVVNRKGKKRIILDARYVNLFIRYMACKYENLADAIAALEAGDWIWLTDFRSGYHQVPMHSSTFPYLGIEIAGQVYFMPFLPFGIASACREYTQLMGEVYRPLRQHGEKLALLIDDARGAAGPKPKAMFHALTWVMALSALGFHLSVEKCQLLPALTGIFLGMLLDAMRRMTFVPADKLNYFLQQAEQLQQMPQVTARQLAKVAGLLVSFTPAVPMAPLYAKGLFKAMTGSQGWDANMLLSELPLQDLKWWQQNLERANGRRWDLQRPSISMASDASESSHAAYQVSGSGSDADQTEIRMEVAFTPEEMQQQAEHALHSTLRELRAIRLALQVLRDSKPDSIRHSSIQWYTDSQAGAALLSAMKGDAQCLEEVKRVYAIAMELDLDLVWQWRPRTHELLVVADAYSKEEDTADINFLPAAASALQRRNLRHPRSGSIRKWGSPTLDVFAGPTGHEHVADAFYTKYHAPGSAGVNAWFQPWDTRTGQRQLAWVFPPATDAARAIDRLLTQPCHAILILPDGLHSWSWRMRQLPVVAEAALELADTQPGPRASLGMQQGQWKLRLRAWRIWPGAERRL